MYTHGPRKWRGTTKSGRLPRQDVFMFLVPLPLLRNELQPVHYEGIMHDKGHNQLKKGHIFPFLKRGWGHGAPVKILFPTVGSSSCLNACRITHHVDIMAVSELHFLANEDAQLAGRSQ